MKYTLFWNTKVLVISSFIFLISILFLLTQSAVFQQETSLLSNAILLDLIVTMPLLYFLIIRKRDVPKITVLSVFVIGIIVASLIIPSEQQFWLDQVKTVALPIVELGILTFVSFQVYKTVRQFKVERNTTADFYTAIKMACTKALPAKLGIVATTEIAMIYYSLFAWKKRPLASHEFSYHKKSGIQALLGGFMFIIIVETFAIHILLEQWSVIAAWILSALSVYTCLQVFALARSIGKRPIVLDRPQETLLLRHGFFSEASILFSHIERIELNSRALPEDKSILPLSPLGGLAAHNIVLHLHSAIEITQLYGFTKTTKAIAFYVDEKETFVQQLQAELNK